MKSLQPGLRKARRPSIMLLLFLIFIIASGSSAAEETTVVNDPVTTPNTATDPAQTSPTDAKTSTTTMTAPTPTTETSTTQSTTESTTSTSSTSTSTTSTSTKEPTTTTTKTTDPKTTSFILSQTSTTTTGETTNPTTSTSTTSINLIPVVTVPPTADAPYMQKSNIPEGTVFIAVGAALGAIGLSVLAWRGLVAWSVNRSVRRAALMHSAENKRVLRSKKRRRRSAAPSGGAAGGGGGVYSHGHARGHSPVPASSMCLDTLAPNAHARSSYMANTRVPSSNSGLFFSPTAGAGAGAGAGSHGAAGKRGSGYLPAGYYSAGSATPGGGQTGDRQSMAYMPSSLSGLRPQSQGYSYTPTRSPPSSPGLPPAGLRDASSNLSRHSLPPSSTSSVNLQSSSQPRAPSAYLEDLFDSHAPSDMSR